ncbi:hypothetical protein EYY94_00710 [Obesumbacterium proteus]|uniref:hypothetical protein n=1 Tax=Obesumbacterium proteus TaxID=82983 RepID=UPI001034ADDD|nr:hypothetical protein [Obesumbacterium proteus]TBL79307.1 hypothetical protein EYY94_00710 [Obesumbacterium proteus]
MQINIKAEKKRIERECARLDACFAEFTLLKQAMSALVANAAIDPVANQKLEQLKTLVPEGMQSIEVKIRQDMKQLEVTLKKLQSQLKM